MSKITASPDIQQVPPEQAQRFIDLFCQDVIDKVNGKLDFATNFNCKVLTVKFTAANTDAAVQHNLGRVASNYILAGQTVAMQVYNGASTNTSTTLYLRSTAAGSATVIVF